MVAFNDRRLTEHIETVRGEAAQRLQELREGVDTLHSGTSQELHEGLRELRDSIDRVRADLGRDIAQQRENLTEYRNSTRQLRRQVEQLRGKDHAPATNGGTPPEHQTPAPVLEALGRQSAEGEPEPDRAVALPVAGSSLTEQVTQQEATVSQPPVVTASTSREHPAGALPASGGQVPDVGTPPAVAGDEGARRDRKRADEFLSGLCAAAAVSTVESECHGDVWVFLQQTAHSTRFPLPIPVSGEDGMVTARMPGPVLIGVLNALHAVHYDWVSTEPPWDRSSIETRALALALYVHLTDAITGTASDQKPGERFRIVMDRRYHTPVQTAPDTPQVPDAAPEPA